MEADIKLVFDILAFTSVMVLIVLGLGVIASMMGIFNFAHGEFVLLGAYTVYLFHERALPLWLGIVVAPCVVALVGFVLERAVIRRFYTNPIMAMLGTFAVGWSSARSSGGSLVATTRRFPNRSLACSPSPALISRSGARSSLASRSLSCWRVGCFLPAPRWACEYAAPSKIQCWRAPAVSPRRGFMH